MNATTRPLRAWPLAIILALAPVWLIGMLLLHLWRQALTLLVAVLSVGGLFLLLTPLVGRPRPTIQSGICVHDHYAYFSFPSGHVSHDETLPSALMEDPIQLVTH